MGLYKPMKQNDGVTTNYHRILYYTQTVNRRSSIAVVSYVDEASRDEEKGGTTAQPYQNAITYETDYTPDMTISAAYDYLKTLPEYSGAVDV